jgi:hypothetical protein
LASLSAREFQVPMCRFSDAGEIAQHLLGAAEWVLAVDHPFAVAQRRQISREGLRICQRSVLAEELEFPGAMSGGELLQDQPAEQARENDCSMRMIFCARSMCLTLTRTISLARNPRLAGCRRARI